jgi:hypothetical protein
MSETLRPAGLPLSPDRQGARKFGEHPVFPPVVAPASSWGGFIGSLGPHFATAGISAPTPILPTDLDTG